MSATVNTNLSSLRAQNDLGVITGSLVKSTQKLASGVRVNSAADDAASLSLSKKLSGQVSSSAKAKDNTQTGINMLQTMDTDLARVQENVQRMRDLSVQASNGVYSPTEREMINKEFGALWEENVRIIKSSKFADKSLFNVTVEASDDFVFDSVDVAIQVGANNQASDKVVVAGTSAEITAPHLLNLSHSQTTITQMDYALDSISKMRSGIGSAINRLQGSVARIDTRKENLTNANSTITDTDYGSEMAGYTKKQILQQTTTSMLQQANQEPAMALQLLR